MPYWPQDKTWLRISQPGFVSVFVQSVLFIYFIALVHRIFRSSFGIFFFLLHSICRKFPKPIIFFCGFFHIQIKCRIRTKQKGLADVVCRPWNLDFFKYQEISFKFISSNKPDCSVFHHKHMARDIFPANLKVTDCEIIIVSLEGCI